MKTVFPCLTILVLSILLLKRCDKKEFVRTETFIETIVVRDTVRDTLLIPHNVFVSRVDTVYLTAPSDTVLLEVTVPVERREFRTDDYHAVIEGYRPELVSMAVFPETRYITETSHTTLKKSPRFGVGIQAGYGYAGKKPHPYIGIGVQYNLFTF